MPDLALLRELGRDPAAAGPAADHLAEEGVALAEALLLFADGTLSREAMAAYCRQSAEVKDGTARERAVLAVWWPEVEVLTENVLALPAMNGGHDETGRYTAMVREQVRALLADEEDLAYREVEEEVDAAVCAFRRRVLRLFPEYEQEAALTMDGMTLSALDVRSRTILFRFLEAEAGSSWSSGANTLFWSSRLGDTLKANGFHHRLQLTSQRSINGNVVLRQRQPAEYLVTPPPPEGLQVGDMVPVGLLTGIGTMLQNNLLGGSHAMVLRRMDASGRLRLRRPDGRLAILHGAQAAPTP